MKLQIKTSDDRLRDTLIKPRDLPHPGELLQNEAFRQWFGQSKIVDEQGLPMVVYHGSDVAIESFDASISRHGIWFSEESSDAHDYGYTITEVYLRIENPYIFKRTNGDEGINQAMDLAKSLGHDGMIITSPTLDEGGDESGATWATNFVVFEAPNIKSAQKNTGRFSFASPNIHQ